MVQLMALLLIVAVLVILVVQNLSPVLGLVILGTSVGALPFSVWLLGAIATGTACTLLIYQLVPQKRTYRPIGQRLSDPPPGHDPTRFADDPPNERYRSGSAGRFQSSPRKPERQNPYDNDWENFRAPEQWDDWGQQQASGAAPQSRTSVGDTMGRDTMGRDTVGDTVRDIESGWGDDDYEASSRYVSRQKSDPDIGWDDDGGSYYSSDGADRPSPRTYEEGWLYGDDSPAESSGTPEPGEPQSDEDEDVYDANYRVIIPPYEAKAKDD
ncbi:hypothetical protein QGP82_08835 [Leptothoe sp. LEGE 181152]|uniref:LapA family protein n=1 Tax=Adonisia turfae CCMR0081 TaxID=2292702 RepID=A0A6M0RNR7_9CYAN|nr:hypothetical protein [Adonisia turfae]MDV3348791.1 hypothetical protein [Leptothoe sp. LEGE 181152]NEZ57530.1 hypothetical protein [Adonisia turfae CCMR0081]